MLQACDYLNICWTGATFQGKIWLSDQDLWLVFKSASNRPFLTLDKSQLPAATQSKAQRVRTQWVCWVHGWKNKLSNLPVAIKRLLFVNENMKTSFARLCFPKDKEFHGFLKIAKVTQGKGYQFSEDVLNVSNPNLAISLGSSYSSRCGAETHSYGDLREIFSTSFSNERPPLTEGEWFFTSCKHFPKARSI